ncbi:MAG: tRNA dihydrouridine synthase DusB [Acidimicrobiales bacterium]|jgi:nifR3 family TIM-barrel protein|nr:tRNA dihydrouridine synthase DusB [Acidimicrobiaceae bacterium]MDP6077955.1 tRNA dihydrouridine synthase DusB [Acidimicrobiales bacterium]MDP7258864.1 tRNA dihydrouridine synthase DusB [Acidimicrobiales bacterium]
MGLRSEVNADVAPAAPEEFETVRVGPMEVWPPVVLAPMAGITNAPFRVLCREMGAGLFVSEMITARGLVDGNAKTIRHSRFGPTESPRSIQLYGTEPESMHSAVRLLVGEDRVDHIDLNFGCPMPKVTRKGGGAALPLKLRLFGSIVEAAVGAAGDVPVTVKFRKGTDDDHLTYLEAGHIAEDAGVSALALHARTAEQLYSGEADWSSVTALKAALTSIPIFGNGDIWEPWDALRMMRSTGCDGVVVGRGCLGRPWLFGDLATVFGDSPGTGGSDTGNPPNLGSVAAVMLRHARLLVDWAGPHGIRDFRKHTTWYLKGYPTGPVVRRNLKAIDSPNNLDRLLNEMLADLGRDMGIDPTSLRIPRSHRGGPRRVVLPDGWLDDPEDMTPPPAEAEALVSGG